MGGGQSIFDDFTEEDIILAFFPCVRFENQIMLSFRGQAKQFKSWSMKEKMLYDMKLLDELKRNYDIVNMMFITCIDRNLKLVMENPYSEEHFLRRYWCFPASVIDRDRRENGDYYAKPTQFWFCNTEPKNNFLFEAISYNHLGTGDTLRELNSSMYPKEWGKLDLTKARSMIHPTYANRFIRKYLIDYEQDFSKLYEEGSDNERAIHEKDIESLKHRLAAIQEMGGDSD